MSRFIFLLLFLIIPGISFAAPVWTSYVSSSAVFGVALQGDYLWCATPNGPVRWDTRDMSYTTYPDAPVKNMTAVCSDNSGKVWFGADNKLLKYDGMYWNNILLDNSTIYYLDSDLGNNVYAGVEGYWGPVAGYYGNCIYKYSQTGTLREILQNKGTYPSWYDGFNSRQSFYLSSNNILGLWSVFMAKYNDLPNPKLKMYNGTYWTDYTTANGVPSNLRFVSVGINNEVFVASEDTIVKYDGSNWAQIETDSIDEITLMKNSPDGGLYIGAKVIDSNGTLNEISHYTGSSWESYPIGYDSKQIVLSMTVDSEGIIYAGTMDGLYRVSGGNVRRFIPETQLQNETITSADVDINGNFWGGTSSGLMRYDTQRWRKYTTADGLPGNIINCVKVMKNGQLWVGTNNGLGIYENGDWTKVTTSDGLLHNTILMIKESPDGIKWVYTNRGNIGINYYDGESWKVKTYELKSFPGDGTRITTMDDNGNMWATSMITDSKNWKRTYHVVSETSKGIEASWTVDILEAGPYLSCMAVGPDSSVWVGTYGNYGTTHGPNYESKIYKVTETTAEEQQVSIDGEITSISFDKENNIWMSFNPDPHGGMAGNYDTGGCVYKNFSKEFTPSNSGLLDDHVSSIYHAVDGSVLFFTPSGLCRYGEPIYTVGVENDNTTSIPQQIKINGNYPNPFNPSTTISFTLPEPGMTKAVIYNIMGQEVRYLINYNMTAGNHKVVWNGKDDSGKSVSSGVYIVRIESGKRVVAGKMLMMK